MEEAFGYTGGLVSLCVRQIKWGVARVVRRGPGSAAWHRQWGVAQVVGRGTGSAAWHR